MVRLKETVKFLSAFFNENFNSKMVRLKAKYVLFRYVFVSVFQFQNGAVKRTNC